MAPAVRTKTWPPAATWRGRADRRRRSPPRSSAVRSRVSPTAPGPIRSRTPRRWATGSPTSARTPSATTPSWSGRAGPTTSAIPADADLLAGVVARDGGPHAVGERLAILVAEPDRRNRRLDHDLHLARHHRHAAAARHEASRPAARNRHDGEPRRDGEHERPELEGLKLPRPAACPLGEDHQRRALLC